jgi:hypothetical protein
VACYALEMTLISRTLTEGLSGIIPPPRAFVLRLDPGGSAQATPNLGSSASASVS